MRSLERLLFINSEKLLKNLSLSFSTLIICAFPCNLFAVGNANVSISTSATSNGSWSLSGSTYTFTPSANTANILNTEIQNRLLGSGLSAGNVRIVTACSGSGSESGNVTTSTTITAATSGTKTLTIEAGGSITLSHAINLTGTTGQPGGRVSFTAASSITLNAAITTSGTTPSGGSNATGGAGGSITLSSTANDIFIYAGLTALGGTGGNGGTGSGGAGGAITISANAVTVSTGGTINTSGGNGPGANGGAGGAVSITASVGKITVSRNITTSGGSAGSANTGQSGGSGGAITLNARTNLSVTSTLTTTGGSNGGYFYQCGGNGGNVNLFGTTISNSTITSTKGTNGGGATCSRSDGSTSKTFYSLPVELLDFTGQLVDEEVVLTWQTLSEINNDYFILERSCESETWCRVAKIPGAGNSNVYLNYGWNDDADFTGVRYYRLTQVDFDGSKETFKIISVGRDSDLGGYFSVYPNPSVDNVNIEFSSEKNATYVFNIYNAIGQLLYSTKLIGNEQKVAFKFDTTILAEGTYYFSISNENGEVATQKVMK